jgi:hypothetical protein
MTILIILEEYKSDINRIIKMRRMRRAEHVAQIERREKRVNYLWESLREREE